MSAAGDSDRVHVRRSAALPERVLQFGSGNFMRAFLCWMIDQLNRQEMFNGRIVISQATPTGKTGETLNQQDGFFTVLERGISQVYKVDRTYLVASVGRAIQPFEDYTALLRCALLPDLRFVFSNTTESGIRYEPCDAPADKCPETFPAQLAALLKERSCAFNRNPSKGLIILPCELIENNGATLRRHVLQHLADWNIEPELIAWVMESCYFLNTLVDRIVPGFPAAEANELYAQLGWTDNLATVCEPYHLLVIEGHEKLESELPFRRAGLNVVWTSELASYRTQKVQLLNGAHSLLAVLGYLCHKKTVQECMQDRALAALLWRAWRDEIMPGLPFEKAEMVRYCATLCERFQNPYLEHKLSSIRLNSVSKFRVRIVPSLICYMGRFNFPPQVLCLSMAALFLAFRPPGHAIDDQPSPTRQPGNEAMEEAFNLALFTQAWIDFEVYPDSLRLCRRILLENSLWGANLDALPGLTDAVATCLDRLRKDSSAYIELQSREVVSE